MVDWDVIGKKAAELIMVVDKLDSTVDAETINNRKLACSSCDKRVKDKCSMCGCYIDIKVTTKVNRTITGKKEITHCPLGKWNDKDLINIYSLLN